MAPAHRPRTCQSAIVIDCKERSHPTTVKTVGLDLAEDVFQVHCVSAEGRKIINKQIKRAKLLAFFETLPECVVGMKACGSAHHWGRELRKLGHDVRPMPAAYVKPYVKRGKTDRCGRCRSDL
ncbi:transposase [Phaeobacter sp. B1627]|uniref:transposase n=1 Tax=Phaeobacter sp. B1627 TaxID=2583809 RepID=UPI00111ADE14|nr:transposase [Phaeobacter sp. B1627]TNJ39443.1 transposase [Phaeobacter sp. B1627]